MIFEMLPRPAGTAVVAGVQCLLLALLLSLGSSAPAGTAATAGVQCPCSLLPPHQVFPLKNALAQSQELSP